MILIGSDLGLLSVAASGGVPVPVTTLDSGKQETSHRWPQSLPDGRRFVYTAMGGSGSTYLGALGSSATKPIGPAHSLAYYVPPGFLVFVRQGVLLAQAFDPDRGTLSGDTTTIAGDLVTSPSGAVPMAVSPAGVLSYHRAKVRTTQLTWFTRTGAPDVTLGSAGPYFQLSLAPDGRQVAVQRGYGQLSEIWLASAVDPRVEASRFASGSGESGPVWSPDGREVAYYRVHTGAPGFLRRRVDGGISQPISTAVGIIEGWSPDGRYLLHVNNGIIATPLVEGQTPIQLTTSGGDEPSLSPDGLYTSRCSSR